MNLQSGRGWTIAGWRRLGCELRGDRVGCDRVSGVDRELDGSSELERDLRTSGIQEGSTGFLNELRSRLGFRVVVTGFGF